jgi:hypothetical protein
MAWKKEWISGRLFNGLHSIRIISLALGRYGIVIFHIGDIVVTPYDEPRRVGSKLTVIRSQLARFSPYAGVLTTAEADIYVEALSEAVRDVYGKTIDVEDEPPEPRRQSSPRS